MRKFKLIRESLRRDRKILSNLKILTIPRANIFLEFRGNYFEFFLFSNFMRKFKIEINQGKFTVLGKIFRNSKILTILRENIFQNIKKILSIFFFIL